MAHQEHQDNNSRKARLTDKKQQHPKRKPRVRTQVSEVEYLNIHDDEVNVLAQSSSLELASSTKGSRPTSQQVITGAKSIDSQRAPKSSRSDSNLRMTSIDEPSSPNETSDELTSSAPPSSGKLTKNLVLAILASAVGSSFQHGYNGGVVNAPEKLINQFINDTFAARYNQLPSEARLDCLFALVVSIFCIGGCVGALGTALVADRLGRKRGLTYNNILAMLAAALMSSSRWAASYELLIFGRFLIGINAGLNAGLAPLYLNEIAPVQLRGALGTIYQLVITMSILLSNVFGLPALLGSQQLWPLLFALPLLPAAIMMLTLPHCAESPKHLLLNEGRELQAQQALAWFRQTAEVEEEMEELKLEKELQAGALPVSLRDMLQQPSLRRPLTIAVVIMLSQQLSGINAVLFFSTSIFRDAGLQEQAAIRATLGMSLVNVLMTVVSLFLVDKAGRKSLHMTGLLGMSITCLVLAFCLGNKDSNYDPPVGGASSVLAVISIYVFIIMFASGPGSIPWFLVGELFPSRARPLASSIAVSVNWFANFTVSLCFLPLSNILHGFVFFIFAALLFVFYLFTYYKVPETKGATAEEISSLFKN